MRDIEFRPLTEGDLPTLGRWLSMPHVHRWWHESGELESVREEYLPKITGREPTEVFVIAAASEDIGIIQRYRISDHADAVQSLAPTGLDLDAAAGIDYLIGELDGTGRGTGTQVVGRFVDRLFAEYPDVDRIIVTPQAANRASCRVLEKSGFERRWSGRLDSDDPADAGPAAAYLLTRSAWSRRSVSSG